MAENNVQHRAKSKGFAALGVPVGAVLNFRRDPEITATVVDDKNKVEYKGKVYPISGLAKELMGSGISGYHAFKYNGVLLAKLGGEVKPVKAREPAVNPADATAPAPQVVNPVPVKQTVPLPRETGRDFDPLSEEEE